MTNPERRSVLVACAVVLAGCGIDARVEAQTNPPPGSLVTYLEKRFGLGERQVRGALGALLVFADQKLSKSDFEDLAKRIPNAQQIMQTVKQQGVVNAPLDDVEEYEKTLTNIGIGQPLASPCSSTSTRPATRASGRSWPGSCSKIHFR